MPDGVIIGSPVYFTAPNGALCSLAGSRLLCDLRSKSKLKGKPAAVLPVAAGGTAVLDRLIATLFQVKCRLFPVMIHGIS